MIPDPPVDQRIRRHFWLGVFGGILIGLSAHFGNQHDWNTVAATVFGIVIVAIMESLTSRRAPTGKPTP